MKGHKHPTKGHRQRASAPVAAPARGTGASGTGCTPIGGTAISAVSGFML